MQKQGNGMSRRQFLKGVGAAGVALVGAGALSWVGRGQGLGVKWGVLAPISGPFATLGEKQMQGAVLALEELKAEGGIFADLEWQVEDTTLKAAVATEKAEKLILEFGAQLITGCISSSSALAVREVIDENEVFYNPSVGANEVTTLSEDCSRWLFRAELMTWQAVSALVHMVRQLVDAGELATRTWLVIPGYAYGFSMRDTWREKTADFIEEVGYSEETGFGFTDHSAIITEILAAKEAGEVDFITTALLGAPLVTFMQQAAEAGLIRTPDNPDGLPVVDPILQFNIREIGDIAVGNYTTIRYSLLHDTPENRAFVDAFKARWDDYPENFAHNAYVAVKMMAEGIKKAAAGGMGSFDKGAVLAALEEEDRFMAPMGESYFRAVDHQIVRDIGAGRIVTSEQYPFPVEQQFGEMLDGEEAIAGIEQKCNLGG